MTAHPEICFRRRSQKSSCRIVGIPSPIRSNENITGNSSRYPDTHLPAGTRRLVVAPHLGHVSNFGPGSFTALLHIFIRFSNSLGIPVARVMPSIMSAQ
jgi:hypothetical protein